AGVFLRAFSGRPCGATLPSWPFYPKAGARSCPPGWSPFRPPEAGLCLKMRAPGWGSFLRSVAFSFSLCLRVRVVCLSFGIVFGLVVGRAIIRFIRIVVVFMLEEVVDVLEVNCDGFDCLLFLQNGATVFTFKREEEGWG